MRSHSVYQKAIKTNKISKSEAILFLDDLYKLTEAYVKNNFPSYVKKGLWPLKARVPGGAQKDPKFIVNHHTSNTNRQHTPALHRFFQSSQASANFLITDSGTILYLVRLVDMSYHATKRAGVIPFSLQKLLGITDGKWLNEPGIEMAGNGNSKLFTPEAFEAVIVLQRIICAYFDGSIKELKSHRFFSPVDRAGDPGPYYFLPLVEHAVFNDVDIWAEDYWLDSYAIDQVGFANNAVSWMEKYGVLDRDEWKDKRKKLKATSQMVL